MPQQKVLKIGLSNADKQAMATDIRKIVVAQLFAPYSSSTTYDIGDFCEHDGTIYKCIVAITTAEAWNSNHWAVAKLNEVINAINEAVAFVNGKANVDGNYPTMTVGNADQLNSTVFVVDKVPYLYRTSGGDADIGNREYDKIIGGSLVVNQLVHHGNFDDGLNGWTYGSAVSASANNGVCSFTVGGRYQSIGQTIVGGFFKGHEYLVKVEIKTTTATSEVCLQVTPNGTQYYKPSYTAQTTDWQTVARIVKWNDDLPSSNGVIVVQDNRASGWDEIQVTNVMFIDLTAMFGSTIADYIYALEQSNAGAGIAWFRNYFKELYYTFNNGAIKNVKLVSHDMVGFNQWDEEWESGTINTETGENQANTSIIRSKNYVRIVPNTDYMFKSPINGILYYYDSNKNYLGFTNFNDNARFTTPSNASYLRFRLSSNYGTTYNNDICINLSWSGWRNGQYEAYQKNSYPLDATIELRGIPKLDSNNHLYFDGDEYSSDGKVVKRYKVITPTSLIGNYQNLQGDTIGIVANDTVDNDGHEASFNSNIINTRGLITTYADKQYSGSWDGGDGSISITTNNRISICIKGITSAADLNTWLTNNPISIVYPLKTPTEETATPFQEPQIVDDFGTEEYVVPTQDGWQVPVGHDTKYPANLRDKLQRLPDMPSVSQNVTETYVVNYNGTTKKCTFVAIDTWLGSNGYAKADTLPTKEALGGTLRQCLCIKESLDFDNTAFVDLGELDWSYDGNNAKFVVYNVGSKKNSITILSTLYKTVAPVYASTAQDNMTVATRPDYDGTIYFKNTAYTDATTFKNAMKGVLLAYEKASS